VRNAATRLAMHPASRETGVPRRPHCPLHVCVEMKLMDEAAPSWVQAAEDAEEIVVRRGRGQHKHWKRKFWKCPVTGCARVMAYSPTDEEEKKMAARKCIRCGAPSDQPGELRVTGRGSICRACLREQWELRREMKRAHKGRRQHYEPAATDDRAPLAAAPATPPEEPERTEEDLYFATPLDDWRIAGVARREARA
jgi:hypothetical protein